MKSPVHLGEAASLRSVGERGLVIEFGDRIDLAVNERVHRLARAVSSRLGDRVIEVVPTYRSLLVIHDPLRVPRRRLVRDIAPLLAELSTHEAAAASRLVHIPACYGEDLGPDLAFVAAHCRLAPEEIIALHCGATYTVCMLGFTPGFPFLGGMCSRIAAPRLLAPRPLVPAGSIGIAGEQTGIYPVASPGGWRIIARTPLRIFDPSLATPFLLAPGDRVRFAPISRDEFDARLASGSDAPELGGSP